MNAGKRFVYILQSESQPDRFYTGLSSDPEARLQTHNAGASTHTATARPWRIIVSIAFADATLAERFEVYLKTGSGRAFARRHFRQRMRDGAAG